MPNYGSSRELRSYGMDLGSEAVVLVSDAPDRAIQL